MQSTSSSNTAVIQHCWETSLYSILEYFNLDKQTFFVNGNLREDEKSLYMYISRECSYTSLYIAVSFYSLFSTLLKDNNIVYNVYLLNPYVTKF